MITNLHLLGKLGRIIFNFESCQTQLVLALILMLPVESLTKEISGAICQIAASSAQLRDIIKSCNSLPMSKLGSSPSKGFGYR